MVVTSNTKRKCKDKKKGAKEQTPISTVRKSQIAKRKCDLKRKVPRGKTRVQIKVQKYDERVRLRWPAHHAITPCNSFSYLLFGFFSDEVFFNITQFFNR